MVDNVFNYEDYATISGGEDRDVLTNYAEGAIVSGDAGDDNVSNYGTAV